jgi:Holliday junction DNA helicase RuvA
LFIETHVREDHIHLYGFADEAERAWFRLLLTVQGVGSKVALSLLSVLSTDDLGQAIASADKAMLARAQGVGPKLAVRLTIELKDKAHLIAPAFPAAHLAAAAEPGAAGTVEDAVSALVNLGYRRMEAHAAVLKVLTALGKDADAGALIRGGLRELGRELTR